MVLLAAPIAETLAQTETEPDTAKIYRLGEVVVTEGREKVLTPVTLQTIPLARIARTDAVNAAQVAYEIPAARIQTNSRGESLLYLRNAGERQIALFLDGSLINVSWDNRLDLSLLPLNAVGGISVAKGVPSVLYGANVSGGAVNIISQELRDTGALTEVNGQFGQNNLMNGSVTHMMNLGDFNYLASVGYVKRDALPLAESADLEFNQSDPNERTNSDSRTFNAFLRGEYHFSPTSAFGLSVNVIDGEKGVPPEGVERARFRFWRYPNWRHLNIALNGDVRLGEEEDWAIRGAAWGTTFSQTIDQYSNNSYATKSATEEDDDLTFGTRIVLRHDFDRSAVSLALNGLTSTHEQRDLAYDSTGTLTAGEFPTLTYRQQIYSAGLEYERSLSARLKVTLGGSLDGMSTPETGGKPSQEGFSDYSLMSGFHYDASEQLDLRLSAGRKTRFPTMRELYGEALGAFVVNPDLKPEETAMIELGADGEFDWGTTSLVAFSNITSNTIDQIRLTDLPGRPRQRINLEGSMTIGGELSGSISALAPFRVDGHFTYMYSRRRDETGALPDSALYLAEKPSMLGLLHFQYDISNALLPSLEVVYTGEAFSPDDDNIFQRLDPSLVLNARLAYRFFVPTADNFSVQAFIRLNNITDEVVMPPLGLPGAGRESQGGIKVTF